MPSRTSVSKAGLTAMSVCIIIDSQSAEDRLCGMTGRTTFHYFVCFPAEYVGVTHRVFRKSVLVVRVTRQLESPLKVIFIVLAVPGSSVTPWYLIYTNCLTYQ